MGALAAAAPTSAPLLPDLNAKLHPSDSTPWTILLVLTLITLLPAILMCMTPLVRLLVVFHFLRQALGTQTAPSNPTLMGLALMMTWFLMTPVLTQVDQQAVEPYRAGEITGMEAIDRGTAPVKHFLLRYAREKDLALFAAAGQIPRPQTPDDLPMRVVAPAYILSELKAGFAIGAVLFLPFLLDRHGDGGDHDFDRHVPVAAGGGVDSVEDSALRDGGRMESAGQLVAEKFLKGDR